MSIVILGLGTNLGNRSHHLQRALSLLGHVIGNIECSYLYESEALLLPDSPQEWNRPYLNMAVKGNTLLSPNQLLNAIKMIEQQLGRQERGIWSPREIDIDILAYGENYSISPSLSIPHASLPERSFALLPFAELWPEWRYPGPGDCHGKTARELLDTLPDTAVKSRKVGALQQIPTSL